MSGNGTRVNGDVPKQYLNINDKPIFIYAIENILKSTMIDKLILVINESWNDFVHKNVLKYFKKEINKISIINGGNTRNQSIINAIDFCIKSNMDLHSNILTHDCARPLVTKEIIEENIKLLELNKDAVINTCINVADTISKTSNNKIIRFIDRTKLLSHQTPQSASLETFAKITNYINKKQINSTDIIYIAKKLKLRILNAKGNSINFKITNSQDLDMFKLLIGDKNDK